MDPRTTIERFLEHLDVERNFSEQSLRAYGTDLRQFCEFLDEREISDLTRVDNLNLRGYLAGMSEANYGRRSIARKLASVRSLFRFLHRRGEIKDNPAKMLRTPKLARNLPALRKRLQFVDGADILEKTVAFRNVPEREDRGKHVVQLRALQLGNIRLHNGFPFLRKFPESS